MAKNSLTASFQEYFKIILADSPELRNEVYRIRHAVYCRELHYESAEDNPGGLEKDRYDDHSYHCLLLHRPSKQYAGCVRLVYQDPGNLQAPLPFEAKFRCIVHPHYADVILPQRGKFGEISRLAVPASFRRRKSDAGSIIGNISALPAASQGQRRFPYIPLGLYLAAAAVGVRLGLNAFAVMEPRLARHMARFGIVFEQAGEIVEFRGKRAPFYIDHNELCKTLQQPVRGLFESILADTSTALKNAPHAHRLITGQTWQPNKKIENASTNTELAIDSDIYVSKS